ncbi:hypothetical protein D3C72_1125540 [compost metagenome]
MTKNFWEENAAAWARVIQENTLASRAITNTALINLISQKNITSVLDVGCGEGWLASQLSPSTQYLGIDGSENLIDIAKNTHSSEFKHVSYDKISSGAWSTEGKFAAAVFNFALLDEDILGLLKNIQNSLISDGFVIIQTLHPCFVLSPYQDGWNKEDFKSMAVPFSGHMPWYGRTLSSWVKLFAEAGLKLQETLEPQSGDKPSSIIFVLQK